MRCGRMPNVSTINGGGFSSALSADLIIQKFDIYSIHVNYGEIWEQFVI